jgi:hypothetical protein
LDNSQQSLEKLPWALTKQAITLEQHIEGWKTRDKQGLFVLEDNHALTRF